MTAPSHDGAQLLAHARDALALVMLRDADEFDAMLADADQDALRAYTVLLATLVVPAVHEAAVRAPHVALSAVLMEIGSALLADPEART